MAVVVKDSMEQGPPPVPLSKLDVALNALDEHVDDSAATDKDIADRGSASFRSTIVQAVLFLVSVIAFIAGAAEIVGDEGAQVAMAVIGMICSPIFFISMLVSFSRDRSSTHIHDAKTAKRALKRFFRAGSSFRTKQLMTVLAPLARKSNDLEPLGMERIPEGIIPAGFEDAKGLKRYWEYVFRGSSSESRAVQLSRVKEIGTLPGDVHVVQGRINITSYEAVAIVIPILAFLLAKREKKTFRKLIARRNDQWYFLCAELEGELDQLAEDMEVNSVA